MVTYKQVHVKNGGKTYIYYMHYTESKFVILFVVLRSWKMENW